MSAIFIGHKTIVSPDFSQFVVEPKAPKNYKDPAKIADYVQDAKNEIMNNSSFKPFTGMIEEICICVDDHHGLEKLYLSAPAVPCLPWLFFRLVHLYVVR